MIAVTISAMEMVRADWVAARVPWRSSGTSTGADTGPGVTSTAARPPSSQADRPRVPKR